ncbi:uncharacterized protein LOC121001687 [Bufo bufo]|uniref:uncharacterized protein LOC121001687 n=1 Tax=Bufo bufo TaxID=8384 RepID=UPI001ABDB1B9|nr:uncharacterized protein LOC121001687 [Bufo bufo]
MSKKEESPKPPHPYRTSVEQLLKCYGSDTYRKFRKPESKHVISRTYSDSSTLSHQSVPRHLEQRPRPQTCAACRACKSSSVTDSMPEVLKMQPLGRTHHLPYHCAKTNTKRPTARHKTRTRGEAPALLQLPHSKTLMPCNGKRSISLQSRASSCSSRLAEDRVATSPCLPALPQSGFLSTHAGNSGGRHSSTYHPDQELRQWIVEFGGDEQAAFMARGLQKLQLAYEAGKAEVYRSAHCKPITNEC